MLDSTKSSRYFESTYVTAPSGKRYGPYYRNTWIEDGKRVREYVRKGCVPLFKTMEAVAKMNRRFGKNKTRMAQGELGRPSKMDPMVRAFYDAAGYVVKGLQVRRSRKIYFTPETASVRYGLLDEDQRELVGSAERLLELEWMATKLLKKRNRLGIPDQTYEGCFVEILLADLNVEA